MEIRKISWMDTEWPLAEPESIWVRGDESIVLGRTVGITGSRACTAYGQHVASDLGYGLAEKGVVVVTGGAFGIDAAAIRGALVAPGSGKVVVVLAGGLDVPYPASHRDLFDQVVRAGGLLVSEYAPGSEPHRQRFLDRNRIIAALSSGVVVVEAIQRSGSRVTMRHARELGRKVMAVPGPVTSVHSSGTLLELRDGAVPVANATDIIATVWGE